MLDDGDKAISYDCRANLYSDSVLCSAPEFLNLEVLLEPLEEQLNLPSVLVEISNFESGKMECIRQKMRSLCLARHREISQVAASQETSSVCSHP